MVKLNLQDLQDLQVIPTRIYTRETEYRSPVKVVKVVNYNQLNRMEVKKWQH